jgi:type IV pilus assembly protein PilM
MQRAGLMPVSVDLIPFALTRLHSQPGNVAFIDVGERTTNVVIAANGVPQFVRIIATGGNDLTQALASRLEIPASQALALKHGLGLGTANVPAEHLPTVQIIREVTSELLTSLRNTLAYYVNIHPNEVYSGLVLSGGGAKLHGFHLALGEITRIPITMVDPFERLNSGRKVDAISMPDRQSFGIALALAIGHVA